MWFRKNNPEKMLVISSYNLLQLRYQLLSQALLLKIYKIFIVSTADLIKAIFARLSKNKWLTLLIGIILAVLLFFYASRSKAIYTSRATVFPLNNQSQSALSGNSLASLIGMNDGSKSFSTEAAINIIELANSRNVREAVSSTRLPQRAD